MIEHLRNNLPDKNWRLDNLYRIEDQRGYTVPFKRSIVQKRVTHELDVTDAPEVCQFLKRRQRGVTSACMIWGLDSCMFTSQVIYNILAPDSTRIDGLMRKLTTAIQGVPQDILDLCGIDKFSRSRLRFRNGSEIFIASSIKSSTGTILHAIDHLDFSPEMKRELELGAMPSVQPGGKIILDSIDV